MYHASLLDKLGEKSGKTFTFKEEKKSPFIRTMRLKYFDDKNVEIEVRKVATSIVFTRYGMGDTSPLKFQKKIGKMCRACTTSHL